MIGMLSIEFDTITADAFTVRAFRIFTQNIHLPRLTRIALPEYFSGFISWLNGEHPSKLVAGGIASGIGSESELCPEKRACEHPT